MVAALVLVGFDFDLIRTLLEEDFLFRAGVAAQKTRDFLFLLSDDDTDIRSEELRAPPPYRRTTTQAGVVIHGDVESLHFSILLHSNLY